MATRFGVPDEVIGRARARISSDDIRLETLLKQVEDDSRLLASERAVLEKNVQQQNRNGSRLRPCSGQRRKMLVP